MKKRSLVLLCIGLLMFNCILGLGIAHAENNFAQVVSPGESWKFVNTDVAGQTITTDASLINGRVYDYVIMYSSGATGVTAWNSEVGLITVPAGGTVVVTCKGTNPVTFGGNYPYITGEVSPTPAVLKQTLNPGESWKFSSTDSINQSITTDASVVNGRVFDYVIYYNNGTTGRLAWNAGSTLLTVPAGGNIIVTCTGNNPVTFGGAYSRFTGDASANSALFKQTVNQGEIWKFVNTAASTQTVITDGSTLNGRVFDYAVYNSDGSVVTTVSNSGTAQITVPAGGNLVVTGTGINPVKFGGAYLCFSVSAVYIPVPIDVPVISGLPTEAFIEQGSLYDLSGTISAKQLTNVTVKVAGYTGGDIFSQALANVPGFDLSNVTIDTNEPALAAAGTYTVEVWASTPTYNPSLPLGQMTLNVLDVPASGGLIEPRSQYFTLNGDTLTVGAVLTQMLPQTYKVQLAVRPLHSDTYTFYDISNYSIGGFEQQFSAAALGMTSGRYEIKIRIIENDQIKDQTKKGFVRVPLTDVIANMLHKQHNLKK